MRTLALSLATMLTLAFLLACTEADYGTKTGATNEGDPTDGDTPVSDDDTTDEDNPTNGDEQTDGDASNGDTDEDTSTDGDIPLDGDDDTAAEPVRRLPNPEDGRLYAAAGYATITPGPDNHPCPVYVAGTRVNRLAEGIHNDLDLRISILAQDNTYVLIAVFDLVGLLQPDIDRIKDAVAEEGFDRDALIVSSTHTHTGPDSMGIWGENSFTTGRCPDYLAFLARTTRELASRLADELQPVTAYAAAKTIHEEGSNRPTLMGDVRAPYIVNPILTALNLKNDRGETVTTLVNWGMHPEAMIHSRLIGADFPRWIRERLDRDLGGASLFLSGTLGGLIVPFGVKYPRRTQDGAPVYTEGGEPDWISDIGEEMAWSIGHVLAEKTIDLLHDASPTGDDLSLASTQIRIPMREAVFYVASIAGIIEPFENLDKSDPDYCGDFGCILQQMQHIRLGSLHMVGIPGEAFPESSIGRPEVSVDYPEPWGTRIYPAMRGWREHLSEGALLMELGLTGNQLGYLVPATDYEPSGHPNFYCERLCVSPEAEELVREQVVRFLETP